MKASPVLLVSLSSIGDAILTTPVLCALHDHFPDAAFHVVADRRSAILFEACPFVERVYYLDKRAGWRGLASLVQRLRSHHYELAADLRTDFLPYLVRARRRFARWRAHPYGPHAVERHMGVIAALHGDRPLPGAAVWPGAEAERRAGALLGSRGGDRLLALGPGANWPAKCWPAARFRELVTLLTGNFDEVVLLGTGAESALSREIAEGIGLPCRDLCGRTSLLEAAAILGRCRAYVGNDSGLGHLAAAAGTATLTLFGPGEPARYCPWGPRAAWIAAPGGDLGALEAAVVAERLSEHLNQCSEFRYSQR